MGVLKDSVIFCKTSRVEGIYGIQEAKKTKGKNTFWGNQLDIRIEALNYKQTNGILTGNSLSRIVSEIILCTVDGEIQKELPGITCRRYVDDYYIYTKDSSHIKEIIAVVRKVLAKYQLSFNESKISIKESPFLYGKPWVNQLQQYFNLPIDIYFTRLIADYNKHKDIAIFKYGLKVLSVYSIPQKNWTVVQSRLINILVRFPSLADRILPILWKNKSHINKNILKEAVYTIIDESILLGHSQELVWAVWYVKLFDLQISQRYALRILKSENDLAIIIMLDILEKRNLLDREDIKKQRRVIRNTLEEVNDPDLDKKNELMWSSHWLLAYEADRKKWLKFPGETFELARKNQFFKQLLEKGIYFYDDNYMYNPQNKTDVRRASNLSYASFNQTLNRFKKSWDAYKEHEQEIKGKNDEKEKLFKEFIDILENEENIY